MKKTKARKSTKAKSTASTSKSAVRDLAPRKLDNVEQVRGGRMWTKGGGASVG